MKLGTDAISVRGLGNERQLEEKQGRPVEKGTKGTAERQTDKWGNDRWKSYRQDMT